MTVGVNLMELVRCGVRKSQFLPACYCLPWGPGNVPNVRTISLEFQHVPASNHPAEMDEERFPQMRRVMHSLDVRGPDDWPYIETCRGASRIGQAYKSCNV